MSRSKSSRRIKRKSSKKRNLRKSGGARKSVRSRARRSRRRSQRTRWARHRGGSGASAAAAGASAILQSLALKPDVLSACGKENRYTDTFSSINGIPCNGAIGGEDFCFTCFLPTNMLVAVCMDGHGEIIKENQNTLAWRILEWLQNNSDSIARGDERLNIDLGYNFAKDVSHIYNHGGGGTTLSICVVVPHDDKIRISTFIWGDSDIVLNIDDRHEMLTGGNADDHPSVTRHVEMCKQLKLPMVMPININMHLHPYVTKGMTISPFNDIRQVRGSWINVPISSQAETFETTDAVLNFIERRRSIYGVEVDGWSSEWGDRDALAVRLEKGEVVANPSARRIANKLFNGWNMPFGSQGIGSGSVDARGYGWSDPRCEHPENISPNLGCHWTDKHGDALMQPAGSIGDNHQPGDALPAKLYPVCHIRDLPQGRKCKVVLGSDGLWDVLKIEKLLEIVRSPTDPSSIYSTMASEMTTEGVQKTIMGGLVKNDPRRRGEFIFSHDDVSFIVMDLTAALAASAPSAASPSVSPRASSMDIDIAEYGHEDELGSVHYDGHEYVGMGVDADGKMMYESLYN